MKRVNGVLMEKQTVTHSAKPPLVSVILPVYNGEAFVAEAVATIVQQAYQPLEILVIDDGSTDNTAAIIQALGAAVHYIYRPNGGPAAARNTGLALAQGEFIAFLDADDLWTDNSLTVQLACLAAHPTAGIALGRLQVLQQQIDATGITAFQPWSTPRHLLILQCALVRRTVFDRLGYFDESYFCTDDIDWFLRAREAGISIVTHPVTTVSVRRHRDNLTNQQQVQRDLALALKKSVARRQAAQAESSLPALVPWSAPTQPPTSVSEGQEQ